MQGIDALYVTEILNGHCGRLTVNSGTLWLYEGDAFRTLPMISMVLPGATSGNPSDGTYMNSRPFFLHNLSA